MPRPRTPLKQAEMSGALDHNPKRYSERVEPQARGPFGVPPPTLSERQKYLWAQLESRVPKGVLQCGDEYIVELTVRLLARMSSPDPDDQLKPVEIGHLRACLGSLGLTPADRSRVNGQNESPTQTDPLAVLFGSKDFGNAPPN